MDSSPHHSPQGIFEVNTAWLAEQLEAQRREAKGAQRRAVERAIGAIARVREAPTDQELPDDPWPAEFMSAFGLRDVWLCKLSPERAELEIPRDIVEAVVSRI